jgi:hypothetical protein
MRKFLWVVAVGVLLLMMAAPAMAVDVKFGGEWRVRFYDYANWGFDNKAGTNPRGIQIRFRPRFDVSDDNGNITATWRGEFGDTEFGNGGGANGMNLGVTNTGGAFSSYKSDSGSSRVGNGAGGGAGADGVALETKWAYIDFALPFNIPLRARVGVQPWYLTKGLVTDDDYSGFKAYGKVAPISYEAAWFRANRGTTTAPTAAVTGASAAMNSSTTKDNAFDIYTVKFDVAINKMVNPYVYYIYGDNRSNCTGNTVGTFTDSALCASNSRVRPQHYVGLGATGDFGSFSYDLDWVWGQAEGGPQGTLYSAADGQPIMVEGWVLDGGIHIPVGPVKFHVVGSYATGDKQDTSGHNSDAFPGGPGPSWSGPGRVAGGAYEIFGEGGDYDVYSMNHIPTGFWTLGGSADYVPVKPLTLRLAYLFIGFTDKYSNCANAKAGAIGCFGSGFPGKNGNELKGKTTLGQEIDLKANYTVWTGFQIQGLLGWLVPSKGDTTGKYVLQFYYNF